MSDNKPERDPEIVELFIEESLEGLARVEALLLGAEAGKLPPDLMARLFRDLHTMKGTSGFLALKKIAGLSHAAEHLLSHLRDAPKLARPEHYTRLLEVVDVLRKMVESVRSSGDEPAHLDAAPLAAALGQQAASLAAGPVSVVADASVAQLSAPVVAAPVVAAPAVVVIAQPPLAPAPVVAAAEEAPAAREASDGTVRVNVAVLDRLMNLMGELVLARNQIVQSLKNNKDSAGSGGAAFQRLGLVTSELQEQIMKTRMQPVARVFEKIPRMVRDLTHVTGKKISCHVEGTTTEIDRALIEAIRDPLMHIVRNAIDHGIETPAERERQGKPATGKLSVRASHDGGMVTIEVTDDGRGMDPAALKQHAIRRGILSAADAERLTDRQAIELTFRAGFSTAEKVTDISGRGVGMDVVRTHVERAGGQVELESVVGKGTTLRLRMPLTLAIIPALLVRSNGQRFAIPQVNLTELVYLDEGHAKTAIEYVRGAPIYRLRGELLPLVLLRSVLHAPDEAAPGVGGVNIVVVAVGQRRYGLVVDEIHDTEEIVIKPLHGQLKRLACYSGATVLGDGGVALILEVAGVAALSGIDTSSRRGTAASTAVAVAGRSTQPSLVFTCGDGAQCAVPLTIVARLEQISASSIEQVGGVEVVQYRKSIMPIVRPERVLALGTPTARAEQQLVVFDFGQAVGMAVDSIVDIVDLEVDDQAAHDIATYTQGKAVVFGKTTLLLDSYALVRKLVPNFVKERRQLSERRRPRVVLADDSNALRAAIGSFLQAQGIDVVEASSGEAAIRELIDAPSSTIDAVITDLEMAGGDGFDVLAAVRKYYPQVPALVWTQSDDPVVHERARKAGARACVNKLDREQLMAVLTECGIGRGRRASDHKAAGIDQPRRVA